MLCYGMYDCAFRTHPPCWDATTSLMQVGTIYIPIHQFATAAVKDTADLLTEHRKLTLPLRSWKIVR